MVTLDLGLVDPTDQDLGIDPGILEELTAGRARGSEHEAENRLARHAGRVPTPIDRHVAGTPT
jgi:hypothetical protein